MRNPQSDMSNDKHDFPAAFRIIVFGHKRIPSREGGVEIVAEEISTRMVERGCQVTCINRGGHHVSGEEFDNEKLDEYKGIRLCVVPTIEKKGLAAASSAFFASIMAAFGKYDVVHIHAEGPAAFCWLPKIMGKKVVLTCHGLDWERPRWKNSFGGKFIKYAERMAVKYADDIIVLSKGNQDYFQKEYGRQTVVIPNGVNCPKLIPTDEIASKWGLSEGTYILALSRLTNEKNIHLLITAYKGLHTNKKLVIAGGSSDSNEYVEYLHNLAENDPRIIFTGFVQGRVLEELYSNAYIYCLPSALEGMPLSLLEAMSYGNCCLVSDISECRDIVEDKAVIFSLEENDDLKDKLQLLCNDTTLVQAYKKNASDFICQKYNWDEVTDRTLCLYREKVSDRNEGKM